ncbi:MAG: hypothetical protein D6696_06555 [Acidobacteria bacterium]|nr:MAG: hypothetical protein D6696_06555 [Acidobacteriota bacterium]
MFAVLFGTWLVWSGHFKPLILAFGLLSCLLVVAITLRMEIVDHEIFLYRLGWRPLAYAPWLLGQIVKANLDVARAILMPQRHPIRRRLIRAPASQKTAIGQVSYGNSITLTPGTLTLDLADGEVLVHALTPEAAAALLEGEMDRRARWLEGGL